MKEYPGVILVVLLLSGCGRQPSAGGRAEGDPVSTGVGAIAVEYTISGRVTWEPTGTRNFSPRTPGSSFVVTVQDRKWQIKLVRDDAGVATQAGSGTTVAEDYEIASFDGEWSYVVISHETMKRLFPGNLTAGEGMKARSDYPGVRSSSETLALWALYSSANFFARRPNHLMPALWPRTAESPWGGSLTQGKWVLSSLPPFLPTSIDTGSDAAPTPECPAPGAPSSFATTTSVRVAESTNFGGLTLPLVAHATYSLRDGTNPNRVVRRLRVSVTNVTTHLRAFEFVPVLPDPSKVTETRMDATSKMLHVSLATNRWPSEKVVLQLLKARYPEAPLPEVVF